MYPLRRSDVLRAALNKARGKRRTGADNLQAFLDRRRAATAWFRAFHELIAKDNEGEDRTVVGNEEVAVEEGPRRKNGGRLTFDEVMDLAREAAARVSGPGATCSSNENAWGKLPRGFSTRKCVDE